MNGNFPSKILLVDSDQSIGHSLKMALERHKINVDVANTRETALYLFNQNYYPVVIIELAFPDTPGLVMLQQWRKHDVNEKGRVGFIVTAGNRNDREPQEARLIEELSGIELIYKPFTAIQLLPYLQKANGERLRNQKFAEVSDVVKTMGRQKKNLDKVLQMIRAELPILGLGGVGLMRELYESHDMYENALTLIDQYLAENQNHIGLLNAKGKILLLQGRVDEALDCMEVADKKAPQNIERINSMAMAYLEVNQPEKAVEKMKQLIDYSPEKTSLKFDLFSKLYDHGFDEHAQELCKETSNPLEVVRHYNNKGVALAKAGRVDQAIAEYERSLEFYPKFKENYRIYYNIAMSNLSFQTRERYQVALDYINRCIELNPKFEKAIRMRGLILEQLEGKKTQLSKVS
ncbi:MAG: tetratricopeptide repeat protein [Oligoflexus sp.]